MGEENPKRDERTEQTVAEAKSLLPQDVFDLLGGKQVGEGQSWRLGELLREAADLAAATARE